MSADILRRAAALMRERAREAIASPWSAPDLFGNIRAEYGSTNDGLLVHGEDCGCGGGIGHEPTAHHIASWHPAVALAVADWLDSEAATADDFMTQNGTTEQYAYLGPALIVAQTYLGESA